VGRAWNSHGSGMRTKVWKDHLENLGWNAIIEINHRKQGWRDKYNSHGSEQGLVIITTLTSSTLQCN